jgi:hypothetical protein
MHEKINFNDVPKWRDYKTQLHAKLHTLDENKSGIYSVTDCTCHAMNAKKNESDECV